MPYDFNPSVTTFSFTDGGKSEIMIAADPLRNSLFIEPQTEALLVNFGAQAGRQATGTLTFDVNPTDTETIAVNGVTFTFVAGASTSTNVNIKATKELTAGEFVVVLNASVNASVSVATYSLVTNVVTVAYDIYGADGNAFTLADSSGGNVTRSGATLTGGSNTVGGIYLATNAQLNLSAKDFPSIKSELYVLSATTAAFINYLSGT